MSLSGANGTTVSAGQCTFLDYTTHTQPVAVNRRRVFWVNIHVKGGFEMTVTPEKQITRELARLRMWRDVANPVECDTETEIVHDKINDLLDSWEAKRAKHSHTRSANDAHCST